MLKSLVILRYSVIFVAVFLGFYFIDTNPELAMKIVSGGMVGAVGVFSFVTHVIFHKADAKRLGWETEIPDWQFEVGFANLAFGIAGLVSLHNYFPISARIIITLAYAIYLLQAAILHGYRALSVKPINHKKLYFSSLLTLVYVIVMGVFVIMSH
jgi:hypothetical protein